ncbi:MAG TPA: glycosyltransferase family 39 protein [Patescibacteria group bacterium]|nr:glycosyltransferase family 39 protein [Patescibacteria group bacterium]
MITFLKKYWLLILAIIIASFLRFYKLDTVPALNADEAAIGYNAYSLIQTGKDEHGNTWPIHFQSFNDYKPGLYFYAIIPFIKFFGLNEWAVRVPGALIGVLTVLVIYFLSKELFKNEKIAGISALFLAISPWHIHFSRGGWEVNLATFLITLGVLTFLKVAKNPSIKNLALSIIPFALSLYAYHAARIIAPILGIGLIAIYRKELLTKKNLKALTVCVLFLIVLLFPLVSDLAKGGVLSRAAGVGLFADQGPINRINEQRGEHANVGIISARFLHNKLVNYGLAFLGNWAAHYHGLFLFVSGDDIERDKVPETGQMYMLDILFVLVGLYFLARSKQDKGKAFVYFWLLAAPLAAALTFQAPHALRSQNMVIPLILVSSLGFHGIISWLNQKKMRLGTILLLLVVVLGFARYQHMYWVHMAKEYPFSSQYGIKELTQYLSQNKDNYQKIYVSDKYDQPYILFLFYMKYSPENFQGNHSLTPRDKFGFSTVRDFDKFHFESLDFARVLQDNSGVLVAAAPDEVPEGAEVKERIYGSNGHEYFDIITR